MVFIKVYELWYNKKTRNTGYVYDDGGRSQYFTGKAGDCVVRAVSIATGRDYKEVYKAAAKVIGYTPRNGIQQKDTKKVLLHFGGVWHPTMGIGTGCRVHLKADELPAGRIVCNCSRHLVAVIDGVIHDNHDPSKGGKRCVYGYWTFE